MVENRQNLMEAELSNLKHGIIQMKQYQGNTNVQISGITEESNELVLSIVSRIGKIFESEVNNRDVNACHHVLHVNKVNKKPFNIIVQLKSPLLSGTNLKSRRRKRSLPMMY